MCELYRDWNGKINVVSRKDIDSLYEHHILHSLAIAEYLERRSPETFRQWSAGGVKVLDLGTGGGFPGIPLASVFPDAEFTLCDSIGKKIKVATAVAEELGLQNVRCVNARVETLDETFDWVVTRAVADLSELYPWVRGKFRKGIICLKGGDINEEISRFLARHFFPAGKQRKAPVISTWPVKECLDDPWYDGKFVIQLDFSD